MKKRIIILGVIILIIIASVWAGLKFFKKQIITFETVKIISFDLTKNSHVKDESVASGTIISKDGLVLTNHHVVTDENEENYEVFGICIVEDEEKKPNCTYTASLIAKNESLDIALLQINDKDIFSEDVKNFNYLDYKGKKIGMDEEVNVIGFPVIGGKTITSTQGQISGYEEKEGTKFLKIDAKIDQGNSGGTVKNSQGKFVGVPSFLKSNYETLGYIIPLEAVRDFIEENVEKDSEKDEMAIDLLNKFLQKKYDAEENRIYRSSFYPYFEVNIPEVWEVEYVNAESIFLKQIISGNDLVFSIRMGRGSFDLPQEYININLERIEKNKHQLKNYNRKDLKFNEFDGFKIESEMMGEKRAIFVGIRENALLSYNYSYSVEIESESKEMIKEILDSMTFLDKENDTEKNKRQGFNKNPKASIETFDSFYISYIDNNIEDQDLLFYITSPDFVEMKFQISEKFLPRDFWNMSEEEIFDKRLQGLSRTYAITDKYKNIQINGMKGFGFTYSYIFDDVKKPHKVTQIFLFKNNKEVIEIIFDDLEKNHDENIKTFVKTISTFKYENNEGETVLPQFKAIYNDLKNYLYESEIGSLINHGILDFEGESFMPEKSILGKEVLFFILKSKVFIEKGRNSTKTLDAIKIEGFFGYAESKKIIDTSFNQEGNINLGSALKIMCKVYELPVWEPPYVIEENLPYFNRWSSMNVSVSVGRNEVLTRGKFAAVLYYFMQSAGERRDF
ncbi:MAG: trypsin-like peptidase domain-containing protein [Candidatus Moranbacteria bacterium]|nr:trypsin-like peptidase domain-containing protein [Candidatus Moranbacteria bacterium]